MFAISNSSEYGLLILEQVKKSNDYLPLSQIVDQLGLPKRFIARVSAELVKAGLLESKEGKNGGYKLGSKINQVSLLDYLKIFEDMKLVKCLDKDYNCKYSRSCNHRQSLHKVYSLILSSLSQYKLSSII
ncbi:MAG: Rrf2 family transcriptional regulator [Patescibacteria group bacterium]|nr:MAG: Rrf2 family transcriptional regulator [Patescibacteria group bacterium]